MVSLKLLLLGPPQVEYKKEPIEIQRRSALALLAYLVVTGDSHRRDTLATLLWPESSQSSARAGLRRDLSILNRTFGGEWMAVDRETAALKRGPGFWFDVEEFQQLIAECRTHDHAPNDVCSDCLGPLTQAVALYRDDFLAGFTLSGSPEFDEWQFFQTEGLRQMLASVLERLVHGYAAQEPSGSDSALPYARRWLALDPLHEPAHQALMKLYAALGQRAAALRQYEECVRLLNNELGVPPSQETNELYRTIKTKQISATPVVDQMQSGAPIPGESPREGRRPDRPSLAPPELRPGNLPAQTTAFIGRVDELRAVREELSQPDVRLLTLTGSGGTGKTRLGLQAAAELLDNFPDGVFFVALDSIRDPALVARTIAETLGVHETGGMSASERLAEYLRHKQLMLLLDNFEHLLPAAPLIGDLLAAAPKLKVLATSRALLRLHAEWSYPVPPLSVPDLNDLPPLERLAEYEAVQLFTERARAVKGDFAVSEENARAVAEICVRVEGLPLAIELAAARVRLLPPHEILAALSDRLGFLTGGARDWPARQRTLRGTIDWSFTLLNADEQTLLERLAVFSGGCSLEAAQAVGDVPAKLDILSGLESLVDKNLLKQVEAASVARFVMLDTIREYALERLAAQGAAEEAAVRQRHARFFLALAEEAELNLYSKQQALWLDRLELEHDNLRSALLWSINHARDVGLRLAGALGRFWHFHGHQEEGLGWLGQALARVTGEGAHFESLRAKALDRAGYLAFFLGELDQARAWSEESVTKWRELGDARGLAHALCTVGAVINAQGNPGQARGHLEEGIALFRQIDDEPGLVRALFWHGHVTYRARDFASARASAQECIKLGLQVGDLTNTAAATETLGQIAFHEGDYAAAQASVEESLHLMRQVEDRPGIAIMLDLLGGIAYRQGHYDEAQARVEESQLIWQDLGIKPDIAWARYFLGYIAMRRGHLPQAVDLFTDSLTLYQELDAKPDMAACLAGLAEAASRAGRSEQAVRLLGAAHAALKALGTHLEATNWGVYERVPLTSQADSERHLDALRAQLGDETFAALWEEGQATLLEEAVALALSTSP
jgi:predicted ATPase/DNA-binding SARP family transcriptional activator